MKMISHPGWTEEGGRTVLKISQKSKIGDLVVQIAPGYSTLCMQWVFSFVNILETSGVDCLTILNDPLSNCQCFDIPKKEPMIHVMCRHLSS